MSERKHLVLLTGFVLAVSLLAASVTAVIQTAYYQRIHFQELGEICQEIMEVQPDAEQAVLSALKEKSVLKEKQVLEEKSILEEKYVLKEKSILQGNGSDGIRLSDGAGKNLILAYGYRQSDFLKSSRKYSVIFAGTGFLLGGAIFLFTLFYWRKKDIERIQELTDSLEKVNTGSSELLCQAGEDAFSKLQDEIYKTVTMLYQTRDAALNARENFAENLSNIAHQIKTPITSISLAAQTLEQELSLEHANHLRQIRQQLLRLTHLEEALLLLSRMDAGTLSLERKEVDVFTVLMLAADNLQEICAKAGVSIEIPETGEIQICADLDWTMEAVMNLLKNCVEHTPPGGTVHCAYEQNPLYTRIRIWDTGNGFAKEDIPHLFERFYRGENGKSGGIGIGLSLSKEIIERQNGTIRARNLPEGGACFEVCFYYSVV